MRQFKVTERITPRSGRAVSIYYTEVERYPVVTPKEEVELANKIQNGDLEARNRLATANLRFVITVAKMYTHDPEIFNDLVAVGNIGLIEAAEKFDPSRGFKFISFAVWHIRKEMLKYLGESTRLVRIPQNKTNELRAILDAAAKLTMNLGRDATMDEVLEHLREIQDPRIKTVDSGVIRDAMSADQKPSSLDVHFDSSNPGDSGTLHDIIPSPDFKTDDFAHQENMKSLVERLTGSLTPLQREIVLRKHGIGNTIQMEESYSSIGMALDMSGERVRQIYTKALRIMNSKARKSGIKEELLA
jgi:RNA polymerase primary sigma factor